MLLSLLVLSAASFGGTVRAASFSSADADFLKGVEQDALGQYAIGALAQNKAQDPRVKALAKTVTANATSANETLKKLASSHEEIPFTRRELRFRAQRPLAMRAVTDDLRELDGIATCQLRL